MPRRPCLEPGCPEWASYRGRCERHYRERERERNARRAGKDVYNRKKWQVLRRRKLSLDPLCERCGEIAVDVHHRHGVEVDAWSLDTLESLCRRCHGLHHHRERMKG
jgi:5-methylcytosine-specific restriction protein A